MSILSDYADKFEQASIDEAYLDVTEYSDGDWDKSLALLENCKQRYRKSWAYQHHLELDQLEYWQKWVAKKTNQVGFIEPCQMK